MGAVGTCLLSVSMLAMTTGPALCLGLVTHRPSTAATAGVKIGQRAPAFRARATDGKVITLDTLRQDTKAVVICFTCNRCPIAAAYEERFKSFVAKYRDKGVQFVAINVNATEDLGMMKQRVRDHELNYTYAYDHSQESAKSFGARVTPHLYLLDDQGVVRYIGAFDDDIDKPRTNYLEPAVDAVLAGQKPETTRTQALGCNIKWRR